MAAISDEALDAFGRLLAERVRDEAISDWLMIVDGRMKSARAQQIYRQLETLGAREIELIRWLVPKIVDTTLHHLLWTLEQEKSVDVCVRTSAGVVPSLREVSDGLAGELYGWIPRFSAQPYEEP